MLKPVRLTTRFPNHWPTKLVHVANNRRVHRDGKVHSLLLCPGCCTSNLWEPHTTKRFHQFDAGTKRNEKREKKLRSLLLIIIICKHFPEGTVKLLSRLLSHNYMFQDFLSFMGIGIDIMQRFIKPLQVALSNSYTICFACVVSSPFLTLFFF